MTVSRMLTQMDTFRYQDGKLCSISIKVNWGGREQHETTDRFCTGTRGGVRRCEFCASKPERIETAAQGTMDDEWVGYFFALEPFDGSATRRRTAMITTSACLACRCL